MEKINKNSLYQKGYEQAKKDFALTWQDIHSILEIARDYDAEVRGKSLELTFKQFFEEVLRRFNERKNEKEGAQV